MRFEIRGREDLTPVPPVTVWLEPETCPDEPGLKLFVQPEGEQPTCVLTLTARGILELHQIGLCGLSRDADGTVRIEGRDRDDEKMDYVAPFSERLRKIPLSFRDGHPHQTLGDYIDALHAVLGDKTRLKEVRHIRATLWLFIWEQNADKPMWQGESILHDDIESRPTPRRFAERIRDHIDLTS